MTMPRIGEVLLSRGIVRATQLTEALKLQKTLKQKLGEVLTANGWVRPLDMYQTLAEQYRLPFINLLQYVPDKELLRPEELEDYIRLSYVPWRRRDGKLVLACADISDQLQTHIYGLYGENIDYVMTSPRDIAWVIEQQFGKDLDERARMQLYHQDPRKSAFKRMGKGYAALFGMMLAVLIAVTFYAPIIMVPVWLVFCNGIYLATIFFKLKLYLASRQYVPPVSCVVHTLEVMNEENLPIYTILLPLHDEAETIPILIKNIMALDYPKSRLDVKLVIEADDDVTLDAIKHCRPPSCFEVIRVPHSLPKTKPKACNYALNFARGEYLTIFDAEDEPDKDQLKKAVAMFRAMDDDVACVQARLNYYNRKENLLAAMFSIEYALLFHYMLPGLYMMKIPIPLSGTSNHIKTRYLKELGEWDSWNVCEDADLGVRISLASYRTVPLDSDTDEEASVLLGQWLKQRTRWIKGYMQTWITGMRQAKEIIRYTGLRGFLGFQLFIGMPSLVYLLSPIFWGIAVLWAANLIHFEVPLWILSLSGMVLGLGLCTQWFMALSIIRKLKWDSMRLAMLAFPFYWFLHSLASIRALWQLIFNPFYWDKTPHGLSKVEKGGNS